MRHFILRSRLIILLCTMVLAEASAQETYVRPARARLVEAQLGRGSMLMGAMTYTMGEWRDVMPGSELLRGDLPQGGGFMGYPSYIFDEGLNGSGMTHLAITLDLSGTQDGDGRYSKLLRMGVTYLDHGGSSASWSRREVGRYDTLTSSSTGQVFYVDTAWTERIQAEHSYARLGIDAAFMLRKRTPGRWDWQLGVGFMAGVTMGGLAEVWRSEERSVQGPSYGALQGQGLNHFQVREREEFRTSGGFWGATYALFGLGWRMGKENPFWSSLQLRYELRPSLVLTHVPGVRAGTIPTSQHLLSLCVDLGR